MAALPALQNKEASQVPTSRPSNTARIRGSSPPPAGSTSAGLGMILAMAISGVGDGLLTRDAATLEEFMILMSVEALTEDASEEQRPLLNKRWRQVRHCGARRRPREAGVYKAPNVARSHVIFTLS